MYCIMTTWHTQRSLGAGLPRPKRYRASQRTLPVKNKVRRHGDSVPCCKCDPPICNSNSEGGREEGTGEFGNKDAPATKLLGYA